MGCFDSTCSISHIPVQVGDEVVAIFVGAELNSKYTYNDGIYQPIMFPIFGEYNDYGDMENINKSSFSWRYSQMLMDTAFKDVTRRTARASAGWDVFIDNIYMAPSQILPDSWSGGQKSKFKIEECSYIEEDVYKLEKSNGTLAGRLFIHREVYDYLLSSRLTSSWGYKSKRTLESYRDDIPELITRIKKRCNIMEEFEADGNTKEARNAICDKHDVYMFDLLDESRVILNRFGKVDEDIFAENNHHPLLSMFNGYEDKSMYIHASIYARKHLFTLVKENNIEDATILLEQMFELFCLKSALRKHNMNMTPYVGFTFEQHQEMEGATLMTNLFNTFQKVQAEKLKRLTKQEEEWAKEEAEWEAQLKREKDKE